MNQTRKPSQHSPVKKYLTDVVWENGTFKLLCEFVRLFPAASKRANLIAADGMADGKEILPSHKLYPTERLVRFYEMEYALPAEHGPAVIRQIRDTVRRQQLAVCFPIEYRYGRGDDILLSPAQGRDTVFISVHMYMGMDYKSYFDALEPIFLRYEGRPHWGKMHTQDAGYLRQAYPHWDTFLAIRQAMDPDGIFLNTYLRQLLGVEAPVEAASAEH
jgi:FAD/FMN-containing dehydrogenase